MSRSTYDERLLITGSNISALIRSLGGVSLINDKRLGEISNRMAWERERHMLLCHAAWRAVMTDGRHWPCKCEYADAWRCAQFQQLTNQVACGCQCHRRLHREVGNNASL